MQVERFAAAVAAAVGGASTDDVTVDVDLIVEAVLDNMPSQRNKDSPPSCSSSPPHNYFATSRVL